MNTHNKQNLIKISQLQRLSEKTPKMGKRQSELTGNRKKVVEMSTSQIIEFIKKSHWEQNKSLRTIAKEMHRSWWWLMDKVKKWNIPVKDRITSMNLVKKTNHLQERLWDEYKMVYKPEHENSNQKGWILEHRYVMSVKLGRPLEKDEVVHHIDGNKLNNHPDNLDLRKMGGRHKYHGVPVFCPHCGKKII